MHTLEQSSAGGGDSSVDSCIYEYTGTKVSSSKPSATNKINNLSPTTLLVEDQVIFYMLQYVYNSTDQQVAKLIKAGQSHKF